MKAMSPEYSHPFFLFIYFIFISSLSNQLPVLQLSKLADAAAESKAICSAVPAVSSLKGELVFCVGLLCVCVCVLSELLTR